MIRRLLIANRGEIAVRVARAAREMGIVPLGVYSQADENAYHLRFMEESACIGPPPAAQSYLDASAIVAAAKTLRADAVHPGYGFLSERAEFARAVTDAGLIFVGPTAESMAAMGSKIEAKRLVRASGVPVVPGYDGADQTATHLRGEAARVGVPLLIKASAGGGGRGMRVVDDLAAFDEALDAAKREALAAFGDDTVLLERYLARPRHIEFQILADQHGNTIHLGERECSIQRRHQKIVEEAPSVALTLQLRETMGAAAVRAAQSVGYRNAGTCEFMLDEGGNFYFLEMNTRLQVEHPVTELVHGVDLVQWQLRIANGERLTIAQASVLPRGWAVETRIYAEDPANHMLPSTGTIARWDAPEGPGIRVDAGVEAGSEVSVYYDPMLAKLIVFAETRAQAIERLTGALQRFCIEGVRTNVPLLLWIARDAAFRAGDTTTRFLAERMDESIFSPRPPSDDELRERARQLLRGGNVPFRIGGVGIALQVREGDSVYTVEASRRGDGSWSLGAPRSLDETTQGRSGAAGPAANGRVLAPMPGKIVKVAVAEGAQVAVRDLLVVLEAMKMEHRIEAPSSGTVSALFAKEGDIVSGGAPLLVLE